jgi:hypothetical protein
MHIHGPWTYSASACSAKTLATKRPMAVFGLGAKDKEGLCGALWLFASAFTWSFLTVISLPCLAEQFALPCRIGPSDSAILESSRCYPIR